MQGAVANAEPNQPAKRGRPTLVTPLVVDKVIKRVANGRTLTSVINDSDLPGQDAIYDALNRDPVFSEALSRARAQSAHHLASETLDIADSVTNPAMVRVAQTRIDARRWLAGKYNSQYSDKGGAVNVSISLEKLITDAANAVIVVENTTPEPQQALDGPKDNR